MSTLYIFWNIFPMLLSVLVFIGLWRDVTKGIENIKEKGKIGYNQDIASLTVGIKQSLFVLFAIFLIILGVSTASFDKWKRDEDGTKYLYECDLWGYKINSILKFQNGKIFYFDRETHNWEIDEQFNWNDEQMEKYIKELKEKYRGMPANRSQYE